MIIFFKSSLFYLLIFIINMLKTFIKTNMIGLQIDPKMSKKIHETPPFYNHFH